MSTYIHLGNSIGDLFIAITNCNDSNVNSVDKQIVVYSYNEILISSKKKSTDILSNMGISTKLC